MQELAKFGIDTHNIIVNQVLFPDECKNCQSIPEFKFQSFHNISSHSDNETIRLLSCYFSFSNFNFLCAASSCRKCNARVRMQKKYIEQIHDLYCDFNVTTLPLLDEEVRGTKRLLEFSEYLKTPYQPNKQ